jgi:hypothetical protein
MRFLIFPTADADSPLLMPTVVNRLYRDWAAGPLSEDEQMKAF